MHRKRRDNTSLNQDLPITKRRLSELSELNDFEYLTTEMLHLLVEAECGSTHYGRFQNGLTSMRKIGGYVWCPEAQFESFNCDYKKLVYQLTDRGKRELVKHGIAVHAWLPRSQSFHHDWMTGHAVASLKLESLKEPGLRFISPEEILSRSGYVGNHPFKFPVKFAFNNQLIDIKNFAPDFAPFGLEYTAGETNHDFFVWETDCDTESIDPESLKRSSIIQKALAYRQLDTEDAFHKRFTIPNIHVCVVTVSESHKRAIMGMVKAVMGKSETLLFKVVPHFRRLDFSPPPLAELWHTGWDRVGYEAFFFNQPEES